MSMVSLSSTIGVNKSVLGYYIPNTQQQLLQLVDDKLKKGVPISAISTGHNWGYGCQLPVDEKSVVFDLKKLNSIVNFDRLHGVVTLEPGVTYGQLAEFLMANGDQWIAPVHGGGPDCSVIGNALERGFGLTPNVDHFSAIHSLKAILADGSVYQGAFNELGQKRLAKLFKYDIGPHFTGLFSQSGVGIVTEVTLQLAQKPQFVELFLFNIKKESDLPKVVSAIKDLKVGLGSCLGGVNLINKERFLSMLEPLPIDRVKSGLPLTIDELSFLGKKHMATPWLVVGALYGHRPIVKSAKKILVQHFSCISKRSFFYNTENKKVYSLLKRFLPKIFNKDIAKMVTSLEEAYDLLIGRPNTLALNLAYLRNEKEIRHSKKGLNPTIDQCGLIWYAPLVENHPDKVLQYIDFIRNASQRFNTNSLITLTALDANVFDSTIPILYNKNNAFELKRAWAFHDYLLHEGAKKGFFPYRLNIETQKQFKISNDFLLPKSMNPFRYR